VDNDANWQHITPTPQQELIWNQEKLDLKSKNKASHIQLEVLESSMTICQDSDGKEQLKSYIEGPDPPLYALSFLPHHPHSGPQLPSGKHQDDPLFLLVIKLLISLALFSIPFWNNKSLSPVLFLEQTFSPWNYFSSNS
jgi:hypothetical protein